jgi:ribonuclease BN (tRNA processing enzyme)
MRLTVVGSGDAFGSGGLNNTCFLIDGDGARLALDFGATSLVALKRLGIDPNSIDVVALTHLHGDHFGGLPFLILDAGSEARRERPLTVIGPPGTPARLKAAMEAFFPGSSEREWRFPLTVTELPCGTPRAIAGFEIESREVIHPSGAPSTGMRVSDGEKLLAYSGDTGWTDALFEVAAGADLFICECYRFTGSPRSHMSFETIETHRHEFGAARIMLTHMSAATLDHLAEMEARGYLGAHDGLVLDF